MKRKMMAMTFALILAALIFAFAGCGSETPSGNPTDNNINKDPYVVSVSNVTPPTKTSYLEGEIFDPTGITFDSVWMIEGQTQTLSLGYGVCHFLRDLSRRRALHLRGSHSGGPAQACSGCAGTGAEPGRAHP